MSERLPYEDAMKEQMQDLPLPDMDTAWLDMQTKLDDEERKRRFLPPVWLRSCLLWSLLLLVTGAVAYWYIHSSSQDGKEKTIAKKETTVPPSINQPADVGHKTSDVEEKSMVQTGNSPLKEDTHTNENPIHAGTEPHGANHNTRLHSTASATATSIRTGSRQQPAAAKDYHNNKALEKEAVVLIKRSGSKIKQQKEAEKPTTLIEQQPAIGKENTAVKKDTTQTSAIQEQTNPALKEKVKDSTTKVKPSFEPIENPVATNKPQKKKTPMYVTGGLGIQQAIPVAGQNSVPYNYSGRSNSIMDYIPSVYLRLHRGKWFLQGEFRYGAPQSVKAFSYSRSTRYDTSTANLTVTSLRLKKTYYHQFPISINYTVRGGLSLGTGLMYSVFKGAVTEKDINTQNVNTQVQTQSRQIKPIKQFTDSFLYKTQLHWLMQVDYEWKRASLGLRYTRDLQPFIKFTQPDGTVEEQKNQSLQVILRYRLFSTRKRP